MDSASPPDSAVVAMADAEAETDFSLAGGVDGEELRRRLLALEAELEDSGDDASDDDDDEAGVPVLELTGDPEADRAALEALMSQPRTRHEVPEAELPVPDRESLRVAEDEPLQRAGAVASVVGLVAVVEAPRGAPALVSGNVLCFEDRTPVGVVDEVFGPVEEPMYSVRFASREDMEACGAEAGRTVFFPQSRSSFVLPERIRNRGTDASNVYDEEVPADEQDFSDDEEEARAKAARKQRRRERGRGGAGAGAAAQPPQGSLPFVLPHR